MYIILVNLWEQYAYHTNGTRQLAYTLLVIGLRAKYIENQHYHLLQ